MKTSKEMADSVFKIRDAYEEKQRKKRIIRRNAIYAVSTACMFGAIFIGIKYSYSMKHSIPEIVVIDSSEDTETTEDTHQTNKVTVSASTSSIHLNTESTKESKNNTVTEASTNNMTEAAETDIDLSTATETDTIKSDPDESTHNQTEPIVLQTEPIITEIKVSEITKPVSSGDTVVQNASTPSGDDSPIVGPEVIPATTDWDSLSMEKKYLEAILDSNIIYLSAEKELPSDMLDDFIAEVQMKGYDGEIEHNCIAKAYKIKEYSDNEAIAIKFDDSDKYYFYRFSTEKN